MRVCSASRGKYSAIGRPFTRICPVPRRRRTLATALFRRPVAVTSGVASGKAQLLRLLRGVGMAGAAVDLELAEHGAPERVLRQHEPHGVAQHAVGVRTLEQLPGGGLLQVPGPARVAVVDLLLALAPRELHLL